MLNKRRRKERVRVLTLALCILFIVIPLATFALEDKDNQPKPGEQISEADFKNLKAEDQEKYLTTQYTDQLATLFYQNHANIGKNGALDLRYFNNPQNAGRDFQASQLYFGTPGNILNARAGAQTYFSQRYKANYQFDASAGNVMYDPAQGTLTSGGVPINLNDYKDNNNIVGITAVADGFHIQYKKDNAEHTLALKGDNVEATRMQDNMLFIKDKAGKEYRIEPSGDAKVILTQESAIIEGQATGTVTVDGQEVRFENREGIFAVDAQGNMKADNAVVNTDTLFVDGRFQTVGKKEVYTYAFDGKETTLVDKRTGVGTISQGQSREAGKFVLTHLDAFNTNSENTPPSVKDDQARQIAQGLRENPPGATQEQQAEVWIKTDGASINVYAKGKVEVKHYKLDGALVLGADPDKPVFTGKEDDAIFDYTTDNAKENPNERFTMQGHAVYKDLQVTAETTQEHAKLMKTPATARGQDVFSVSCEGCEQTADAAVTIQKNIVVFGREAALEKVRDQLGLEEVGDGEGGREEIDLPRGRTVLQTSLAIEYHYDATEGKLKGDIASASLKNLGALMDVKGTEMGFDHEILVKVEGEETFLGVGRSGIGRYEETVNGKTKAVGIVFKGKDLLGSPQRYHTGIDFEHLDNQEYVSQLDQSFRLQAQNKGLQHALQQEMKKIDPDARLGADGNCLNQACTDLLKGSYAILAQKRKLEQEALKAENAQLRALIAAAKADGKSTKQLEGVVRRNKEQFDALGKEVIDLGKRQEERDRTAEAAFAAAQRNFPLQERPQEERDQIGKDRIRAQRIADDNKVGKNQIARIKAQIDGLKERNAKTGDVPAWKLEALQEQIAQIEAQNAARNEETIKLQQKYNGDYVVLAKLSGDLQEYDKQKLYADRLEQATADDDQANMLRAEATFKQADQGNLDEETRANLVNQALALANQIQDPEMRGEVLKQKQELVDQAIAQATFDKLNQQFRDVLHQNSEEALEREYDWLGKISMYALAKSEGVSWEELDKRYEGMAADEARRLRDAAYATLLLTKKGYSLNQIRTMSKEQMRETLGETFGFAGEEEKDDVNLGDMAQFHSRYLRYDARLAEGHELNVNELFDRDMREVDDLILRTHNDPAAAYDKLTELQQKYGPTRAKIPDYQRLQQALKEAEDNMMVIGLTPELSWKVSQRTIGKEVGAKGLDLTAPLDFAGLAVKAGAGAVRLARAVDTVDDAVDAVQLATRAAKLATAEKLAKVTTAVGEKIAPVTKVLGVVAEPVGKAVQRLKKGVEVLSRGVEGAVDFARKDLAFDGFKPRLADTASNNLIDARAALVRATRDGNVAEVQRLRQEVLPRMQLLDEAETLYQQQRTGLGGGLRKVEGLGLAGTREQKQAVLQAADDWFVISRTSDNGDEILGAANRLKDAQAGYMKHLDIEVATETYFEKLLEKRLEPGEQLATAKPGLIKQAVAKAKEFAEKVAENMQGKPVFAPCSHCTITPNGKIVIQEASGDIILDEQVLMQAATDAHHTIPEALAQSEPARGLRVMEQNQEAVLGRTPVDPLGNARGTLASADVRRPATSSLGEAHADLLVQPIPAEPAYARVAEQEEALREATERELVQRIVKEEGGFRIEIRAKTEELPMQPVVRHPLEDRVQNNLALIENEEFRLQPGPAREGVAPIQARMEVWVDRDTGDIKAIGSFDQVGEVATDPSLTNIVLTRDYTGQIHTTMNLEDTVHLANEEAQTSVKRTLAEYNRLAEEKRQAEKLARAQEDLPFEIPRESQPEVIASAPPPPSLEKLPAIRTPSQPKLSVVPIGEEKTIVTQDLSNIKIPSHVPSQPELDAKRALEQAKKTPQLRRPATPEEILAREETGIVDVARIEREAEAERIAQKVAPPVAVPTPPAQPGIKHIAEVKRLAEQGDFDTAMKYLAKNRKEMRAEDAVKIEELLNTRKVRSKQLEKDLKAWLDDEGEAFLRTEDGKAWYAENKKSFFQRLFFQQRVDMDKLGRVRNNYPPAYLDHLAEDEPYLVDFLQEAGEVELEQLLRTRVREVSEYREALMMSRIQEGDVSEGLLFETGPALFRRRKTVYELGFEEATQQELKRLGVRDILGRAGETQKELENLFPLQTAMKNLERRGFGFGTARLVDLEDGRTVVWKLDSSNDRIASAMDKVYKPGGLEDGGRRQFAMARILDEFDTVMVPRMKRIQTSEGYGIIESEFIPNYHQLGKSPVDQSRTLDAFLMHEDPDLRITQPEYYEIVRQAQEQAGVNLVFGAGDVELGFVRLPHNVGDDPRLYIRIVRFDEEQAFLGLTDYSIMHQRVGLEPDAVGEALSHPNDQIYGLFNREEFFIDGVFDVERAQRRLEPVVRKLDELLADEEKFLTKLQASHYTEDEAQEILLGARRNLQRIKDELDGRQPGMLQKMIDNNGEILATSTGEYVSKVERLDVERHFRTQAKRARLRDLPQPQAGVIDEFVPQRMQGEVSLKAEFELEMSIREGTFDELEQLAKRGDPDAEALLKDMRCDIVGSAIAGVGRACEIEAVDPADYAEKLKHANALRARGGPSFTVKPPKGMRGDQVRMIEPPTPSREPVPHPSSAPGETVQMRIPRQLQQPQQRGDQIRMIEAPEFEQTAGLEARLRKTDYELPEGYVKPKEANAEVAQAYRTQLKEKGVPQAVATGEIEGEKGTVSDVFRGYIDGVEDEVALKIAKSLNPLSIRQWQKEAERLAEIQQVIPVPRTYGIVDTGGNPAIAMEIVRGKPFKDWWLEYERVNPADFKGLITEKTRRQLEEGLRAAVAEGWTPRDVQYFIVTEPQMLGLGRHRRLYEPGDVVFFDVEKWEKLDIENKEKIIQNQLDALDELARRAEEAPALPKTTGFRVRQAQPGEKRTLERIAEAEGKLPSERPVARPITTPQPEEQRALLGEQVKKETSQLSESESLGGIVEAGKKEIVGRTPITQQEGLSETIKKELDYLGISDVGDTGAKSKALTLEKLVESDTVVAKLSLNKARVVTYQDGRRTVMKVDTSNPMVTRKSFITLQDGGRRQLAMAGILDETGGVYVPSMRRIQFADGSGVVEAEFVENYQVLGKLPEKMRENLETLVREQKITIQQQQQLEKELRRQGVINLLFGTGDVEVGIRTLPDGTVGLVRFDEEQAFLGLYNYPITHEYAENQEHLGKLITSPNDYIFGLFRKEEYYEEGLFNVVKFREEFGEVVRSLEPLFENEQRIMNRLIGAGYTAGEAMTIFNNARKHFQRLKLEVADGGGGFLEKMINNNGRLLATSDGVYLSAKERKLPGYQNPETLVDALKRGNMRTEGRSGVIATFTSKKERVAKLGPELRSAQRPDGTINLEQVASQQPEFNDLITRAGCRRGAANIAGGAYEMLAVQPCTQRVFTATTPEEFAQQDALADALNEALAEVGDTQRIVVEPQFADETLPEIPTISDRGSEFYARELPAVKPQPKSPDEGGIWEVPPELREEVPALRPHDAREIELTPEEQAMLREGYKKAKQPVAVVHRPTTPEEHAVELEEILDSKAGSRLLEWDEKVAAWYAKNKEPWYRRWLPGGRKIKTQAATEELPNSLMKLRSLRREEQDIRQFVPSVDAIYDMPYEKLVEVRDALMNTAGKNRLAQGDLMMLVEAQFQHKEKLLRQQLKEGKGDAIQSFVQYLQKTYLTDQQRAELGDQLDELTNLMLRNKPRDLSAIQKFFKHFPHEIAKRDPKKVRTLVRQARQQSGEAFEVLTKVQREQQELFFDRFIALHDKTGQDLGDWGYRYFPVMDLLEKPEQVFAFADKYKEATGGMIEFTRGDMFAFEQEYGAFADQVQERLGITHLFRYGKKKGGNEYDFPLLEEAIRNLDPAVNADKPLAVFVVNKYDWNGAFRNVGGEIDRFRKTHKILISEVDNNDDFFKAIQRAGELHGVNAQGRPNKPIQLFMPMGHGEQKGILLGTSSSQAERAGKEAVTVADKEQFEKIAPYFGKKAEITPYSCSVGGGRFWQNNMVKMMAKAVPQANVQGGRCPIAGVHVEIGEELKFSFRKPETAEEAPVLAIQRRVDETRNLPVIPESEMPTQMLPAVESTDLSVDAQRLSSALPLPPRRKLSIEETVSEIRKQEELLSGTAPLSDSDIAIITMGYYQRLQDAGHAKGTGVSLAGDIPALRRAVTHPQGSLNFLRQLDTLHPEAQKVFLGGDGIEYLAPAHRLLSERPELARTHYLSRLSLASPDELRNILTEAKRLGVHPDDVVDYTRARIGVKEPIGLYAIMDEAIRSASAPSRESNEFYQNLAKQFATLVMGFPVDRNRALEVIAGFAHNVDLRQPVVLVDIAGRAHVQPLLLKSGVEWLADQKNWASLSDAQRVLLGNDHSLFRNAQIKVHLGITDFADPENILYGKNMEGIYLKARSAEAGMDVFETARFADIEPESLIEGVPHFVPSPANEQADALLQRLVLFDEIKRAKAVPEIAVANRAALGGAADHPKMRAALDDLTVPIVCGVPSVTGAVTGLVVSEPCTTPRVIIRNPVERARAIRVRMVMDELGLPKLEIRSAEEFIETLDDLPAIDYNILQTMQVLGLDSEKAAARFDDLERIAAVYKAEVGFLDAGEYTPQLSKLVEEGVLTEQEYIKLRKGAPMVMGGMTEEDLAARVARHFPITGEERVTKKGAEHISRIEEMVNEGDVKNAIAYLVINEKELAETDVAVLRTYLIPRLETPFGIETREELTALRSEVMGELEKIAYTFEPSRVRITGSATTGRSSKTGKPFSAESDLDINILMRQAEFDDIAREIDETLKTAVVPPEHQKAFERDYKKFKREVDKGKLGKFWLKRISSNKGLERRLHEIAEEHGYADVDMSVIKEGSAFDDPVSLPLFAEP